jgi:hypothetical protein
LCRAVVADADGVDQGPAAEWRGRDGARGCDGNGSGAVRRCSLGAAASRASGVHPGRRGVRGARTDPGARLSPHHRRRGLPAVVPAGADRLGCGLHPSQDAGEGPEVFVDSSDTSSSGCGARSSSACERSPPCKLHPSGTRPAKPARRGADSCHRRGAVHADHQHRPPPGKAHYGPAPGPTVAT